MTQEKDRDLTGRKVGEYEIISRLGSGGMGVVYEGLQKLIGKRVAVKVLLSQLSSEQEIVDRFLSEARAVNAIRHRGIVDIFSFGQLDDGSHYFVMEYLDGQPFDRIVKERGAVPAYEVLSWTSEILDALDAAHAAGVIHRDIKPSNLFLVNTGRGRSYVKLLDFGIAKLGALKGEATPQTRASVIIGTPDYMSPEQARGRAVGAPTDLYALGCVLYELFTGQRLFRGENPMQTMFMHVENQVPSLLDSVPTLPKEVDDLVRWMLEKDPVERPQNAGELRLHVEALLRVVPNERTVPVTPPPRTYPPGVQRAVPATPSPASAARRAAETVATPSPSRRSPAAKTPVSMRSEHRVTRPSAAHHPRVSPAGEPPPTPPPPRTPPPAHLPGTTITDENRVHVLGAGSEGEPNVSGDAEGEQLEPQVAAPGSSPVRVGLIIGTLLVVGFAASGLVWRSLRSSAGPGIEPPPGARVVTAAPTPEPVAVKPEPKPEPVAVKPEPKPEPVAVKPEPKPEPVAVKPEPKARPAAKVYSSADLDARLAKLESKLAAKEAVSGSRDRVLHQFLEQASAQAQSAKTDDERREVWKFLNEVHRQIEGK